ncbi:MAG TPA: SCO family protein [Candidatus Methylomirabilis sp.]|nr:SCO family protein [Candidatus Methylomirabilis sp.]
MERRDVFRGALGLTLAGATLAASPAPSGTEGQQRVEGTTAEERRRSRFLHVPLQTQDGRTVRFYDDLIKDKTVLVSFFYTSCTDDCPIATANLVQVQKAMGSRVGRDFFMYSISVDPEHDTPAVLREYATRLGVKPGWLFLTGKLADIEALRRLFGDEPGGDFRNSQHLNLLAFGIEPLERWGSCPSLINPKWIVRYLSWIDPKGTRPTGWWPPGHAVPGEEQKSAGG